VLRTLDRATKPWADAQSKASLQQAGCKGELFQDVIAALKRAGHELRIIHGYTDYPERIGSDVDAASADPTQIPHILSGRHSGGPITTVQLIQHETSAYYYILHRDCGGWPVLLALDICSDYQRDGRVFFSSGELLENPRRFKFFDVPSPEIEFAYYTIKKVLKGSLDRKQSRRLGELYSDNPVGCERQLERFFPSREAKLIAEAARGGDWGLVSARIPSLRRTLLSKLRRERPLQVLRYWLGTLRRAIKRVLQPTGLMVVFLGPDGSGKSSVIDRVERDLAPAFRRTAQYRLRPSRRKSGGKPVTDPHARPLRGAASSSAKLAFWLLDYTLGYAVRTFPQLVRSTFILFDRYYQDLLVDPRRYRYGGPRSLARLMDRIIPRPHLFVVLDAPPEILYARKQEIPFEETVRQREGYLNLACNLPNGHVVDASKSLDEVVAETEEIILSYMAGRTARRLKLGARR
jgi:thymidylate kinase